MPSTGRPSGAAARSAASVVPSPPSASTRSQAPTSPRGATSCSWPGRAQLDDLGALLLRPVADGRERVARARAAGARRARCGRTGLAFMRPATVPSSSRHVLRLRRLAARPARRRRADRRRRRRRAARADVGGRHALLGRARGGAGAERPRGRDPARTCAASTRSTPSSPSASPRPATTRSSSTTSAARPGSARAARTSSTCRTCSRRARARCRPTPRRRGRAARADRRGRGVTSASASAARSRSSRRRTPSSASTASVGFYGSLSPERWGEELADPPRRRHARARCSGSSAAPTRASRPTRSRRSTQPRRGRRRARDRHLPRRAALVLRPPLRGARRGVRRRVAANPRLPLAAPAPRCPPSAAVQSVGAGAAGEHVRRRRRPTAGRRRRRRRACPPPRRPRAGRPGVAEDRVVAAAAVDPVVAAEAADDVVARACRAGGRRRACR